MAGSLDIGNFADKQVDDFSKRRSLESHWQPPENYSFPHSVHNKGGKEEKRYLSHSHLFKFNWLVLSDSQRGLYCKQCALFTTGSVGGYQKNVRLRKLVTRPLTKFARLLGKDGDLLCMRPQDTTRKQWRPEKTFLHVLMHQKKCRQPSFQPATSPSD